MLETKLLWAAAEANQRVLAITQELSAAHKAVSERVEKEAAARELITQETLIKEWLTYMRRA